MATIADVAERAGVSTATVSRVLNGTPVRSDLTEAVHRAAAELNYSPNRAARSLRRRYSEVLALVLPDIENPFFTSVARGVEDVARQAGLSVVLCNTDDQPDQEERYLRIAESENMAGVILAPASQRPDLGPMLERGRAVVVLDRPVPDPVDQVFFDNVGLGRAATRGLLAAGHRRIACVTGPEDIITAVERASGWRSALEEAGRSPDSTLVRHANYRVDGGRRAVVDLLESGASPDAIVATNNLVGVGVLQELASMDEPPPVGLAVIGDLPFVTSRLDHLLLLPLRPRDLGASAARMLLDRLGGLTGEPRRVVLPVGQIETLATVAAHQQGWRQ